MHTMFNKKVVLHFSNWPKLQVKAGENIKVLVKKDGRIAMLLVSTAVANEESASAQ